MCPSRCGSERWDSARSEDEDQAVSQQHHPHLPRLLLPISCLPASAHPAGAGLQLYCRYTTFKNPLTWDENSLFSNRVPVYSCFPGIFNYYHLSLLLTSLNCVADPALYCFVSESARHGLFRSVFKPVARILCCCCRRGNTSPSKPATDSHEVATEENNGHPVMLLTHTNTVSDTQTDGSRKNTTVTTPTDEKNIIPLTVQHHRPSDKHLDCGINRCVIAMEEQSQKAERTEGPDKSIG